MKFRKKPVVIEAVQWFEKDHYERLGHTGPGVPTQRDSLTHVYMKCHSDPSEWPTAMLDTLEGPFVVRDGDWIITGIKGEKYPCKPDIFAATYDPAE